MIVQSEENHKTELSKKFIKISDIIVSDAVLTGNNLFNNLCLSKWLVSQKLPTVIV